MFGLMHGRAINIIHCYPRGRRVREGCFGGKTRTILPILCFSCQAVSLPARRKLQKRRRVIVVKRKAKRRTRRRRRTKKNPRRIRKRRRQKTRRSPRRTKRTRRTRRKVANERAPPQVDAEALLFFVQKNGARSCPRSAGRKSLMNTDLMKILILSPFRSITWKPQGVLL